LKRKGCAKQQFFVQKGKNRHRFCSLKQKNNPEFYRRRVSDKKLSCVRRRVNVRQKRKQKQRKWYPTRLQPVIFKRLTTLLLRSIRKLCNRLGRQRTARWY